MEEEHKQHMGGRLVSVLSANASFLCMDSGEYCVKIHSAIGTRASEGKLWRKDARPEGRDTDGPTTGNVSFWKR